MTDLFAKATKTPKPKAKVAKKDNKREVEHSGLQKLAAFKKLEDDAKAAKEAVGAELKQELLEEFAAEGKRLGKCPDSYRGVEHIEIDGQAVRVAEASMELRKKSSASAFDEDGPDHKLLEELGIPLERKVSVPHRFIFNQEILENDEFRAALSEAIASIDVEGFDPADVIREQEEEYKIVTTEDSLDVAFDTLEGDELMEVLELIGVAAIKAKLVGDTGGVLTEAVSNLVEDLPTPEELAEFRDWKAARAAAAANIGRGSKFDEITVRDGLK